MSSRTFPTLAFAIEQRGESTAITSFALLGDKLKKATGLGGVQRCLVLSLTFDQPCHPLGMTAESQGAIVAKYGCLLE